MEQAGTTMMSDCRVALIDDDAGVIDAIGLYLRCSGFGVQQFMRAEAFLESLAQDGSYDCIVSDIRMPGMTGLELQQTLNKRHSQVPLVLITAQPRIDMAVAAVKAGAANYIEKPLDEVRLTEVIRTAVGERRQQQAAEIATDELTQRVATLSERQRQVMDLAVQGFTNKEIAGKLDISPRTVETYRNWVMQRTGARNLAELVRLAMRLEARG